MSDTATRLSDLCSICAPSRVAEGGKWPNLVSPRLTDSSNTNSSKYRCPACAARTCSLPCYKRHQQWATCSGVRDPTKFVKKSQLATPAGVDHDFNYLSSVERTLDRAEQTLSATAGRVAPPTYGRQTRETQYARIENLSGAKIVRAPQGLSRRLQNKSHPSNTKRSKPNVVWTVEWINDANKHLLTETSSTSTLAAADPFDCTPSRKRKPSPETLVSTKSPSSNNINQHGSISPTNHKSLKLLEQELGINKQQQHPECSQPRSGTSDPAQEEVVQGTKGEGVLANTDPTNILNDGSITKPMGHEQHRLFLLRPRTSSSRRVLIPLDPSATLADCLHGRTVLEFPTIYAFPGAKAQLPEEFILEKDYIKQEGEEQEEFNKLIKDLDPEVLRRLKEDRPQINEEKEEEVDSARILDVLKQDLLARGRRD